jgi:membrane protein YdbS with pleckstrin-like domain
MRFKAKIEWWYYALTALPVIALFNLIAVMVFSAAERDMTDAVLFVIVSTVLIVMFVWLISVSMKLAYIITDTALVIEHGKLSFQSQKIPYENIKSVSALKNGRLMIKYYYKKRVLTGMLWVQEREEFLKRIEERLGVEGEEA